MSSPSRPQNGVYSELQLPHRCSAAQSLASLPVTRVTTTDPFRTSSPALVHGPGDDHDVRAMVEPYLHAVQGALHFEYTLVRTFRSITTVRTWRLTMSNSMGGKVVVVSGASMGVVRATAERFAQDGATVVLLARRKVLLD